MSREVYFDIFRNERGDIITDTMNVKKIPKR